MNEPQVWTLIGVFSAAMFSLVGLVVGYVRAEIGGLRAEMIARFERVDVQFAALDRDMQAIAKRVFPES